MTVDLRHLRYFVVAAEELNFTRAAQRLSVVQQSLSAAVGQLETQLGMKLFHRTTRNVALTEAGEIWLPYARDALAAADRADDAARDLVAGRTGRLRIGLSATAALELTPRLLRAFADSHPLLELATEHYGFDDPTGGLRDGAADVAIVRPPFRSEGLELAVVASEDRYVILPSDHPLAGRGELVFADIEDQPWMDIASDPLWCGFWRVGDRRTKPVTLGARGRTLDDLLEAARAGRAVGLVPESIMRAQPWPGLAFVRVADIPPATVAVAWRRDAATPAVLEFAALARELGTPS
jgi:DNA-binding transcriptional LysR family regulator